jgi:glycosyltransferase involved in cell wall biosynthesis
MNNTEERLKLGENALELARIYYNFEDHANKIIELYKDVIDRRKVN